MDDETQECSNCKKLISKSNFTMHIIHCHRNFSVCKKCKDVFPVNQLEEHLETAHKKVKCQLCNEELENYKIEEHESSCMKRLVQCVYCELEVFSDELNDHENYCGSRTELCSVCNQYVMIKDQTTHEANGHPPVDKKTNTNNNRFSPLRNDFSIDQILPTSYYPKKTNLETELYTRQSPSKRNNDMPQVNTNFPLDWKDPEKINISDVEADSSSQSNEVDRLIAMQLQEMADAAEEGNDDIDEPTGLGGLFNHAIFPDSIREPARNNPFSVNSDLFWSPQTLDEIFRTTPDVLRNESSFSRPTNRTEINNTVISEDELPCEFCGLLYPADLLVQHESGCCPDIAHGLNPESYVDVDVEETKKKSFEPINKMNLVTLPCDYCKEQFPEDVLLQHEEICQRSLFEPISKTNNLVTLPCEYCKEQFLADELLQHEELCEKNPEIAAQVFLRDLVNPTVHSKSPTRKFSNESLPSVIPKLHPCPLSTSPINSPPNKPVLRESKPPADYKFRDLLTDRNRSPNGSAIPFNSHGHVSSPPNRDANEINTIRPRRSSDRIQRTADAATSTVNLPRFGSGLDKSENRNVNLMKTKPNPSNLYLNEMKHALRRPQEARNLVVTGTKPKSLSENPRPAENSLNNSSRGNKTWGPIRQQQQPTERQLGSHVPTYCKSNDGRLEDAYQRFVAQKRAQYGTNSQQRASLQPKLKQTGAVPKTSKKSSSEE